MTILQLTVYATFQLYGWLDIPVQATVLPTQFESRSQCLAAEKRLREDVVHEALTMALVHDLSATAGVESECKGFRGS